MPWLGVAPHLAMLQQGAGQPVRFSSLQLYFGMAGACLGALCFWPVVRRGIALTSRRDWALRKNASTLAVTAALTAVFLFLGLYDLFTGQAEALELFLVGLPLVGYCYAVWRNGNAPIEETPALFAGIELGGSYIVERWWYVIALLSGTLLLLGIPDRESRLWGVGFLLAGLLHMGYRLFQRVGPPPVASGAYERPLGQMVIATLVNVLLGFAAAVIILVVAFQINWGDPYRPALTGPALAISIGALVVQCIAIPLHAWWSWFGRAGR